MSMHLKYSPATQDSSEFHRIREWHNTFNAFVQGELAGGELVATNAESRELRRRAAKFANSVHGSIAKTKTSCVGPY